MENQIIPQNTNTENKITCYVCNEELTEFSKYTHRYKDYCENCFNDKYFKCEGCGEYYLRGCDLNAFDGYNYCTDCFNDKFIDCADCGRTIDRYYAYYSEDREANYCRECYDNLEDNNSFQVLEIPFKKIKSKTFKEIPYKQYCGCEIECYNNKLYDNQFKFNDLLKFNFSQIEDGSLDNGGVEFKSNAFNGDSIIKNITEFSKELSKRDYYINQDCGLHIHIQIKKTLENIKKILLFYSKYEDFFFKMVSYSRRNNNYCLKTQQIINDTLLNQMLNSDTIEKFKLLFYSVSRINTLKIICKEKYNQKRYLWYNLHSIFLRNTLEIRLHNGTIDHKKIINWIKLNLTILNFIDKLNIDTIKLLPKTEDFFLSLFDSELKNYIVNRFNRFKDVNNEENK